jgi:hypothetical protein
LEDEDLDTVTLCPIMKFSEFAEKEIAKKALVLVKEGKIKEKETHIKSVKRETFKVSKRDALIKGHILRYYLLDKCTLKGYETEEEIVVDFGNTYSLPLEFLKNLAKRSERIRVLEPYANGMSHAYGNYFSRPPIPSKKK